MRAQSHRLPCRAFPATSTGEFQRTVPLAILSRDADDSVPVPKSTPKRTPRWRECAYRSMGNRPTIWISVTLPASRYAGQSSIWFSNGWTAGGRETSTVQPWYPSSVAVLSVPVRKQVCKGGPCDKRRMKGTGKCWIVRRPLVTMQSSPLMGTIPGDGACMGGQGPG